MDKQLTSTEREHFDFFAKIIQSLAIHHNSDSAVHNLYKYFDDIMLESQNNLDRLHKEHQDELNKYADKNDRLHKEHQDELSKYADKNDRLHKEHQDELSKYADKNDRLHKEHQDERDRIRQENNRQHQQIANLRQQLRILKFGPVSNNMPTISASSLLVPFNQQFDDSQYVRTAASGPTSVLSITGPMVASIAPISSAIPASAVEGVLPAPQLPAASVGSDVLRSASDIPDCPLFLQSTDEEFWTASSKIPFEKYMSHVALYHARLSAEPFQQLINDFRGRFHDEVHDIAAFAFNQLQGAVIRNVKGANREHEYGLAMKYVMAGMMQLATESPVVVLTLPSGSAHQNCLLGVKFKPDAAIQMSVHSEFAVDLVLDPKSDSTEDVVRKVFLKIGSAFQVSQQPASSMTVSPIDRRANHQGATPTTPQLSPPVQTPPVVSSARRATAIYADGDNRHMQSVDVELMKSMFWGRRCSDFMCSEMKLHETYRSSIDQKFMQSICMPSFFASDEVMFSFRMCPGEMMVLVTPPFDKTCPMPAGRKRVAMVRLFSVVLGKKIDVVAFCRAAEIMGAVACMANDPSQQWLKWISEVYEVNQPRVFAHVADDKLEHTCGKCTDAASNPSSELFFPDDIVLDERSSPPASTGASVPSTATPSAAAQAPLVGPQAAVHDIGNQRTASSMFEFVKVLPDDDSDSGSISSNEKITSNQNQAAHDTPSARQSDASDSESESQAASPESQVAVPVATAAVVGDSSAAPAASASSWTPLVPITTSECDSSAPASVPQNSDSPNFVAVQSSSRLSPTEKKTAASSEISINNVPDSQSLPVQDPSLDQVTLKISSLHLDSASGAASIAAVTADLTLPEVHVATASSVSEQEDPRLSLGSVFDQIQVACEADDSVDAA